MNALLYPAGVNKGMFYKNQLMEVGLCVCVCVCVCVLAQSCPTLCDPMDCSPLGSLSMEYSKQEHWSGLPFPSPWDLPDLQTCV